MFEEIMEVRGDVITLKRVEDVGSMQLSDLVKKLEVVKPTNFPSVPRSAVFIHQEQVDNTITALFLCEIAPGIKTISKHGYKFRLAMPWTYLWFVVSRPTYEENDTYDWSLVNYRCFQSKTRYAGENTDLYVAFMSNIDSEGGICFGSTGVNPYQNIADRLDNIINDWFQSEFNSDLDDNIIFPYGGDLEEWQAESRANPNCWEHWGEWGDNPKFNVSQLVEFDLANTRQLSPTRVRGVIPAYDMPATFGRAKEWALGLDKPNQIRLFEALKELIGEQS